jgi:hypothetical protein
VKKLNPVAILLGGAGLAVGIVGVFALREATLSTHEAVAADSSELIVSAKTKGGEQGQTLEEMVEAQVLTCRLEVASDIVGEVEPIATGDGEFRVTLRPAMDETNRRQFRGCVEDFMIDHVQINVLELENVG